MGGEAGLVPLLAQNFIFHLVFHYSEVLHELQYGGNNRL